MSNTPRPLNTPRQVLFASLIGTTIEFFDFYIYATAAVLVFPKLFFPSGDPASATLQSLAGELLGGAKLVKATATEGEAVHGADVDPLVAGGLRITQPASEPPLFEGGQPQDAGGEQHVLVATDTLAAAKVVVLHDVAQHVAFLAQHLLEHLVDVERDGVGEHRLGGPETHLQTGRELHPLQCLGGFVGDALVEEVVGRAD